MHSRVFGLRNVNDSYFPEINEGEVFESFVCKGIDVDYVDEISTDKFKREVECMKPYFLGVENPDIEINCTEDGKYYIKIPTSLMFSYIKECMEDCKEMVGHLNSDEGIFVNPITGGTSFYLGDNYGTYCIGKYGNVLNLYEWAASECYENKDKDFVEYEVMRIFDYHF